MSRTTAWLFCSQLLIALGCLLGCAESPSPNEDLGSARSAATTPPPETGDAGSPVSAPPSLGLVADQAITLGERVKVSGGSVGVRTKGDGTNFDPPRIRLGKKASIDAANPVLGDSVMLGDASAV